MDCLYIVIPAYNEEENIELVVDSWYQIIETYAGSGNSRLMIIDDGSNDNTFLILKEMEKKMPLLLPIKKENSGHGATLLYAYDYALKHGANYVFQTDSDGQTLPDEFHDFWKEKENYDMIVGSRTQRKDGISRIIVTKVLKSVLYLTFKEKIEDANTPFRLMNAVSLKKVIEFVPPNYNLTNVVVSVAYKKLGYKVRYVPITFRKRQGGINSINLRKIYKIGVKAITDFRNINKQF